MSEEVEFKKLKNNEEIDQLEARIKQLKEHNEQLSKEPYGCSIKSPVPWLMLREQKPSNVSPLMEEPCESPVSQPVITEHLSIFEKWMLKNFEGIEHFEALWINVETLMQAFFIVEVLCLAIIAGMNSLPFLDLDPNFLSLIHISLGGIAISIGARNWFSKKIDKLRKVLKVQEESRHWKNTLKMMIKKRTIGLPLKTGENQNEAAS